MGWAALPPPLIAQVERTLHTERIRRKYALSEEEMRELTESLAAAEQAVPREDLPIASRDPKDNQLLAVAVGRAADYLIAGDDDLLVLDGDPALGTLRIVRVRDFRELLAERSGQQAEAELIALVREQRAKKHRPAPRPRLPPVPPPHSPT